MHLEIERKFLVAGEGWRERATGRRALRDGLVSQGSNGKVRVRLDGERAWLTVKGARSGISRTEFEYEIPVADAEHMLAHVCSGSVIEKTRFLVPHAGQAWEVDVFQGRLEGLVWAEVELQSETQTVTLPPWAGREVTGDPRFRHANLLMLCAHDPQRTGLADLLQEAGERRLRAS
ncbi:CYTH domain-containing protein [Aureimonas jatrophae]|uniref:CYTH domain-containing protein n=1 Tax=Aureimonas jatrophae TaxID=1166073 RepID=A0A1H0FJE3_9HYPH|nr:CYTH domain-containing protein [Aureimonas jatrophae]MBB3949989.1 CYTH domain-containing protein [Aureimonas jatrophae]SDN94795.1 CYTH domain-containing protein [Aureimonas jatrophae]